MRAKRTVLSLLTGFFLACAMAGNVMAQSQLARFAFEEAEAAFANKDYEAALRRLDEAQTVLGKINPPILYLRILARHELLKGNNSLDFDNLDRLRTDTATYLNQFGEMALLRDQAREVYRLSRSLNEYPTREQYEIDLKLEQARRKEEEARRIEELAMRSKPGHISRDCEFCPEMVVLPPGTFLMGSPEQDRGWLNDNETPQHQVSVKTMEMGRHEVTQAQWQAIMGSNPSHFKQCGPDCPVDSVSWEDVQEYLRRLNQKTGKRYRLPTESEWEYAARAGTITRYHWGDEVGSNHANCDGCGSQWDNDRSAPVGRFTPNGFGLHDMSGNVWEWVEDTYHPNYESAPADGSAWIEGGVGRVVRGGSWYNGPPHARPARRHTLHQKTRYYLYGFRLARSVP